MIDIIKLFVCIAFMLYSCRSDLKTRTVPNKLWGVVFVAALPLVIADALAQGSGYLLHTVVSVVGIYVFVYILFQIGVFGGADAKAVIATSFIFPAFPDITVFGYELPLNGAPLIDILAFSTLVNAILLTTAVPLTLIVYNLCTLPVRDIMKNPWHMITGYKCKTTDLEVKHVRRMDSGGFRGVGDERVWVTQGIPFMIPITAGFVIAVIYGDLLSICGVALI